MVHHAIIVTCKHGDPLLRAYDMAKELELPVTGLYSSGQQWSFFVTADGFEEGAPAGNLFDRRRRSFTDWLRNQEYADGGSWFSWVELSYGESNSPFICGSNNELR